MRLFASSTIGWCTYWPWYSALFSVSFMPGSQNRPTNLGSAGFRRSQMWPSVLRKPGSPELV
jgi:hypothetical protein